jgi:hypothetical protein
MPISSNCGSTEYVCPELIMAMNSSVLGYNTIMTLILSMVDEI